METIKIRIERFNPEKDKAPKWETYDVPFHKTMRILDAVKYIKDNLDGTLSYRWNCGMGLCGSCAMEVNGVPMLTCKTELKRHIFGVSLRPLRAFPVVKDLVADYSKYYDLEKSIPLHFISSQKPGKFLKFYDDEIKEVRKFRSCIECFICNDNCRPVREGKQNFLGPKSIVKAMQYELHPKDTADRSKILEAEGLWNCATTRCCQYNCPEKIPITDKGIIPAQEKSKKRISGREKTQKSL